MQCIDTTAKDGLIRFDGNVKIAASAPVCVDFLRGHAGGHFCRCATP
jgi:hypothetical protein